MSARPFIILALPAVMLMAGCVIGPKYERPSALGTNALPAAFSSEPAGTNAGQWKTAGPAAHLPRGRWWEIFGDAELDRLEALATGGNQQLAAARGRFEQARAQFDVARADFFPHVSASANLTRQRTSVNSFDNGGPSGVSHTYNLYTIPLDASWEADLWGRVRQQTSAARARLAASDDDLEAARLAVQAEVAADYFTLRALDAESALLGKAVTIYYRALELVKNRRAGGIATDLEVAEAETQVRAVEAQVPAVDRQRARVRHSLATLCGQSAQAFEWSGPLASVNEPPAIPAALPSELLERRPDIAAAERRMAAANADIGVAQTAFYPRVLFHGMAGFQSINAGTLFDWPSRVWAIGPTLELPLFTGGKNRAQLAGARASYDTTVAEYRQTVLTAFQEVEDQLAAQRLLAAQLAAEEAALAAAKRTLEIANHRYRAGLITYLEVAIAQGGELAHERAVVQLRAEWLTAGVGLAKALGGGWAAETK